MGNPADVSLITVVSHQDIGGRIFIMLTSTSPASEIIMLIQIPRAGVWVIIALASLPTALVCGTVIVLVLAVERGQRVEAIKALPPLVRGLAQHVHRFERKRHSHPIDDAPS